MAADEEELLDTRPPRPVGSRRLLLLAGCLVAAAVGAVLVRGGGGHPIALPTPTPPPSAVSTAGPNRPLVPAAAVTSTRVTDAVVGDTVYAVDGGAVITVDLNTGKRFPWRAAPGDGFDVHYQVLADPDHQRLWVVRTHDDDIDVSWFDTTTLAQTGEHTDHGILGAAALLDGRLYLTTTSGVVVLSETEEVSPRPSGLRAGEAMAADPVRHRLVIAHVGSVHPDVVAQQPGRSTPQVRAPAPFERGDLVVSAGRIWAVGFGDRHATIARLDPRTLRPVVFSSLQQHLAAGAVLVQADERHLLVRDGEGGPDLWCLDAGTGAVTHYWPDAEGTPVLAATGVYTLVAGRPLRRLASSGCTG